MASARRRRRSAMLGAALLLAAVIGADYALGLLSDTVEVVDRGNGIVSASLQTCGTTLPLGRVLLQRHRWRVTPPRLCAGPTRLTVRLEDGSVDSCTAFHVHPGSDWRVTITQSGCSGFEATALPAW